MPLSEDDQRIFREIEQTFYESDPEFARRVATTPSASARPARNIKLGVLGLVVGCVAMLALLSVSLWASFVGVLIMFGSGYVVVDNAKKAGRIGLSSLNEVVSQRRETMTDARARMRGRFRRDDEE